MATREAAPTAPADVPRRWARSGDAPLDRWSWAHLASGLLLAITPASWWLAFVLLAAFEVAEAGLRRWRAGKGVFEHESWLNIAADLVVGMVGFVALRLLLGRGLA